MFTKIILTLLITLTPLPELAAAAGIDNATGPCIGASCSSEFCCEGCRTLFGVTNCWGCSAGAACEGDILSCAGCYTGESACTYGGTANTCCD